MLPDNLPVMLIGQTYGIPMKYAGDSLLGSWLFQVGSNHKCTIIPGVVLFVLGAICAFQVPAKEIRRDHINHKSLIPNADKTWQSSNCVLILIDCIMYCYQMWIGMYFQTQKPMLCCYRCDFKWFGEIYSFPQMSMNVPSETLKN